MDVTITIHNPKQIHVDCITSLLEHKEGVSKLIIVDNASTELEFVEEISSITSTFQGTSIWTLDTQFSIGESWNLGISELNSDLVLVSNDDIVFTKNWCRPLIDAMEQDQKIGVLQPFNTVGALPDEFPENYTKVDRVGAIPSSNFVGCCFVIRKSLLTQLKQFDKLHFQDWNDYTYFCDKFYPFGPEDQDFYRRVREIGYTTKTHFNSYVHHYTGQVMSSIPNFEELKERGNQLFHERWSHGKI